MEVQEGADAGENRRVWEETQGELMPSVIGEQQRKLQTCVRLAMDWRLALVCCTSNVCLLKALSPFSPSLCYHRTRVKLGIPFLVSIFIITFRHIKHYKCAV